MSDTEVQLWAIQDTVAPRKGIDQIHWSDWTDDNHWIYTACDWPEEIRHGHVDQYGAVLSVRCLEKDMPKSRRKPELMKDWAKREFCTEDDPTPVTVDWLLSIGGGFEVDTDNDCLDESIIGWSTSTERERGPGVALYVEDWQLCLDGSFVPNRHLTTRGQVRKLLNAVGIRFTEKETP